MSLNIVVADDETPICQWLVYCISRAPGDHHVVSASNGNEAFEKILEQKPDIVFTDIRMPGMDGLELMRRTIEVLPFTVFVILTNFAEFSYAREAISLGAREYLLKSELRAADIEKLLSEVSQQKDHIKSEKNQDTYPSGCVDLYNYYQMQDQPDFADHFWMQQGMKAEIPYVLLCVPSSDSPEEWRRLAKVAESVCEPGENGIYAAIACDRGLDYMVLQTNQNLVEQVENLEKLLYPRGSVGVSSVFLRRADFPRGLSEATAAWTATFFKQSESTIFYRDIQRKKPLDRDGFQRRKHDILELVSQRRYPEAVDQLHDWFRDISEPNAEDVNWTVDACRRVVLTMEECYTQETEKTVQVMNIPANVQQCIHRCNQLLNDIKCSYFRRCSPSISEALEYMHQHYMEDISMAEVAQQVYRSPGYFSRQFKEEVGENFNVYLTMYRLDRAQEMLRSTDLRISEIAERVGYTSAGYFAKMYKRYKGTTPELERISK